MIRPASVPATKSVTTYRPVSSSISTSIPIQLGIQNRRWAFNAVVEILVDLEEPAPDELAAVTAEIFDGERLQREDFPSPLYRPILQVEILGTAAQLFRGKSEDLIAHILRGARHRIAAHRNAGTRVGALVIGRNIGVDFPITHPIEGHVENFRGDLAQRRRGPLPDLAGPGLNDNASHDRDLYGGACGARLAAAILETHGEADAAPATPRLFVSDALRSLLEPLRKIAVDRGVASEIPLAGTQHVLEPDFQRIEPEPPRDHVDLTFAGEVRLRAAESAE